MPWFGLDIIKFQAGAALKWRQATGQVHLVSEEQKWYSAILEVCGTARHAG